MDFGLAFSYVFKDPDWFKKIAIAGVILLIPILGQLVVLGWALNITKRVINRDPEPLPNIDFGADLGRGFAAFVISFVYALPITLLSGILGIIDTIVANQSSSDVVAWIVVVMATCFGLFALVYGLLIAVMLPAAYGNYVAKGSLGAAFNVGQVFGLVKKALGAYVMVVLGMILVGFIAPLGSIACIIGVVLTVAYSQAVMGHFYGQAYNEATKGAAYIPAE
jgi:hypothetical protein